MVDRRSFVKTASLGCLASVGACTTVAATPTVSAATVPTPPLPSDIAGDLSFSEQEYQRRYAGIRARMAERDIDALVVTGSREWHGGDLGDLRYLGAPIDWDRTYVLVPLDGTPIVFNKVPGFPALKELGGPPPLPSEKTPVAFDRVMTPARPGARFSSNHGPTIAAKLVELGLSGATVGIASMRNMPADVYTALTENAPNATFVDAQSIMTSMRHYKSAEEILFLRRSGYVADAGFAAAASAARAGVHDLDIYYAADKACAKAGGPAGGFQLLGSGPWGKPPSSVLLKPSSARSVESGDMIIPEIGSDYKGYFTQLTAPISIGEPTDSFYQALELCDAVYAFVLSQFTPGKTVWEIDDACASFTKDASDGAFTTLFGVQAGEHELTFWHDNYELRPGAMAYLQPFFLPLSQPGGPFHVYGNAVVMTESEPIVLHQTPMELVTV